MNPNGARVFEERPLLADTGNEREKHRPGKVDTVLSFITELTRIEYLLCTRRQGSWEAKSGEGSSLKALIINQSANQYQNISTKTNRMRR